MMMAAITTGDAHRANAPFHERIGYYRFIL